MISGNSSVSRRRIVGGGLAAALSCGLMPTRARAQQSWVMKLGTQTLNDAQHEWMKIFGRAIEAKSGGKIKAELYPASQLGTAPRMIEGTQFGSIQGFVAPPEFLSGVDTRFEVLGSPGLFKDLGHAHRVMQEDSFNKAFLALGANKGLKGVGLFVNAPAVFLTRNRVSKLADLENLKIRVFASTVQMEQIRKLKATPVPMPLGEVLPALQQGTIDGVMSVMPVLTALKFYDAAKYLLETEHATVGVVTVISKIWYDKLPPDMQAIVTDAGQIASKEIFDWATSYIGKQRQAWQANGGQLSRLSAQEQNQLVEMLRPIGSDVTSKSAPDKALFELLKKAAEKTA